MSMTPDVRKLLLATHVTSSVGWLGAVAGFLVLSIVGLTNRDADTVRGMYIAMNALGLFMIVPLSIAALATGLIQSLGTHWGLFRHYWVLTKFSLTVVATTLLLLHQFTAVAEAARISLGADAGKLPAMRGLGIQLVFDAGAAVVVLVVTTTLSVYKPWGKTGYGRRVEQQASSLSASTQTAVPLPIGLRVFVTVIGVILASIVIIHLAGGGLGHH